MRPVLLMKPSLELCSSQKITVPPDVTKSDSTVTHEAPILTIVPGALSCSGTRNTSLPDNNESRSSGSVTAVASTVISLKNSVIALRVL